MRFVQQLFDHKGAVFCPYDENSVDEAAVRYLLDGSGFGWGDEVSGFQVAADISQG